MENERKSRSSGHERDTYLSRVEANAGQNLKHVHRRASSTESETKNSKFEVRCTKLE